jgi:hypothetical protein
LTRTVSIQNSASSLTRGFIHSNHEVTVNAIACRTKVQAAYQQHLQHLQLKGLRPKTIEAYARAVRRIGTGFDHRIDDLS